MDMPIYETESLTKAVGSDMANPSKRIPCWWKAIPPPKEREPSRGNYKQMPEGPLAQPDDDEEYDQE